MPTILVSADDDRHPQHSEFLDFIDSPLSAVADWQDLFEDECVEVDWSDMTDDDLDALN